MLELNEIQSGVLRPRPTPYQASYLGLRIDDARAGRRLMKRASEIVASAAHADSPDADAWISVALTYAGLKALGVPVESLKTFPEELRQGMAARAAVLGDRGENAPEHWERPFGTDALHVLFAAVAPDADRLAVRMEKARQACASLGGL